MQGPVLTTLDSNETRREGERERKKNWLVLKVVLEMVDFSQFFLEIWPYLYLLTRIKNKELNSFPTSLKLDHIMSTKIVHSGDNSAKIN